MAKRTKKPKITGRGHVRMIREGEAAELRGSGKAESIVHGVGCAQHQTGKHGNRSNKRGTAG